MRDLSCNREEKCRGDGNWPVYELDGETLCSACILDDAYMAWNNGEETGPGLTRFMAHMLDGAGAKYRASAVIETMRREDAQSSGAIEAVRNLPAPIAAQVLEIAGVRR